MFYEVIRHHGDDREDERFDYDSGDRPIHVGDDWPGEDGQAWEVTKVTPGPDGRRPTIVIEPVDADD